MKKIVYLLVGLLAFAGTAMAQDLEAEPEKTTITLTPSGTPVLALEQTEFDFGTITQGDIVTHVFSFVNEGSAPLVISDISTPCGCTVPEWSKEPIAPGASGAITLKFDSKGKMGNQIKTCTIMYNSEKSPDFITLRGAVVSE